MHIHWKDITFREEHGRYRIQVTGHPPVFIKDYSIAKKVEHCIRHGYKPHKSISSYVQQAIGREEFQRVSNKKQRFNNRRKHA